MGIPRSIESIVRICSVHQYGRVIINDFTKIMSTIFIWKIKWVNVSLYPETAAMRSVEEI